MHFRRLNITAVYPFLKDSTKNQRQLKDEAQIKGCIPRIIFLVKLSFPEEIIKKKKKTHTHKKKPL